ncbi:uncharacterized protein VNE69_12128 [Vairimorpha necatrix]|uniref:Membrane protein n=1 Tax=Vairimorpha necatrix TaxID=6039 RepID=A0AAX4JI58_9MICR
MKNLDIFKKIWALSTLFFVLNYFLFLFLLFVRLPLSPFPHILNIISLFISYSIGLRKTKDLFKLFNESNFFCLVCFLFLPSNILLFPFFLLGIYNLISFVLSNRKVFENMFILDLCMSLSTVHVMIGRVALFSELICLSINFLMFLVRKSSLGSLISYGVMVRQQYIYNNNMRSVVNEMRNKYQEIINKKNIFYNNNKNNVLL